MSSPRSPTGAVAISGRHASSSQVTSPTLLSVPNSRNVFFSSSSNEGESNFAVVDINPGQTSRWLGDVGRVNQAFTSEYAPISPVLSPVPTRFTFPTPPPQPANHRRKPPAPPPLSGGASPTSPTIPCRAPVTPRRKPPAPPPPTTPGEEPLPLLAPNPIDSDPPPLAPKPSAKAKTPASPSEDGESLVMLQPPLKPRRKPPAPPPPAVQIEAEDCSTSSPSRFTHPPVGPRGKPPAPPPPPDSPSQ
ncbi:DNA-directed RNA polymerase II subunit RPB1 [Ditylenchus destructor]|nr:DNA-directed RNA polymerase II subunit RPB1 [Ditylenchus destructor]